MKFKTVNNGIVLFLENNKDDYLYNHQLAIVDDYVDEQHHDIRLTLPKETITSSRYCFTKHISMLKR